MTNVFQKISAIIYSLMALTLLGCAGYSLYIILLDGIFYPPKIIAFAIFTATAIAITTIAFFITKAAFKGKSLYKLVIISVLAVLPLTTICSTLLNFNINYLFYSNNYLYVSHRPPAVLTTLILSIIIIATALNILVLCFNSNKQNGNEPKIKNSKSTKILGSIFSVFSILTGAIVLIWYVLQVVLISDYNKLFETYSSYYLWHQIFLIFASIILILNGVFSLICVFSNTMRSRLLKTAIITFMIFIVLWFLSNSYSSSEEIFVGIETLIIYIAKNLFNANIPSKIISVLDMVFSFQVFCPLGLFTFIKIAKKYNND